ncbi:MAG TPA: type II toxin-antitoxin system VapC family toxin [Yinghuangia sp.]|uniref:type II toxin-antitoxin system VapC family toxin n=1 Tax=Yinghuangia sp. YIM S10712 TaxID=3436930 RepID=UPI002BCABF65|nr:type II toxin-antitoxin system VapC family toxin [Yinghuangia sp.]
MIVIDCSALVQMYVDEGPAGTAVRGRIAKESTLIAPFLIDIEVASALFGMARGIRGTKPKLSQRALDAALQAYAALPLRRMEHVPLLPRVRELCTNLSAYDASYVALAELYDVPLITSDVRIGRANVGRCPIETYASPSTA